MTQTFQITIPTDISFNDLKLTRNPDDGSVSFDEGPVLRLCAYNNIDPSFFTGSHDATSSLFVLWYQHHVTNGGARDEVADSLIDEVLMENVFGGGLSHAPGHA